MLKTQAQLTSQQQLQKDHMDRLRTEFTQQLAEAESRLARVHAQASHEVKGVSGKVDSLQGQMQVMLESMQAISAATIAMVPSVPPLPEQRPFRYRVAQGKKYGNYQGPKEHTWREFRPMSRSNGSARMGEDHSHKVQFASLANSNVTTPGVQTPVMTIQELSLIHS